MTPAEFIEKWGPEGDDPALCQVRYMMLVDLTALLAEREQAIRKEVADVIEDLEAWTFHQGQADAFRDAALKKAAAIRARGAADTP